MKRKLVLVLAITLLINLTFAQNFDKAKLDNYFNALEANNKFMGSVALSKDGKIIYSRTIGFCDIEKNIKANENSKYRIGSISKTFTAVLIFKAIEQNKLSLTQTIDAYFPTINNANKITIHHLLCHRSGIYNFTNDKDYFTWNTKPKSEKEMIDIIVKLGSNFEPDTKAEYSNSNYLLLSYILEKTLKKPYAELVKEYITKPLGLKNTYMGGKITSKDNECNSYRFIYDWQQESETALSSILGAGGIISTPSDLAKFSDALFSSKLITKEHLEQMKTIQEHYGMGLVQIPFYDKISYGHDGIIDGFVSVFGNFQNENISYAFVSNGSNFKHNDILIAMLSSVFNEPYEIPEFKTYEPRPEDMDAYLGVYSSTQIPLKITITKNNTGLVAQATGQSSFPLEAVEKDKFQFVPVGIVLEFKPIEKTMILKQFGSQFTFTKE